jgi:hypothetical protein
MANQIPVEVRIAKKMREYFAMYSPILAYCNKQYNSEWTAEASSFRKDGFGQTINIKNPPRYSLQNGPSVQNPQSVNIGTTPLTINKWYTVMFSMSGWENNFSARNFDVWGKENLKPALDPILAQIETDLFNNVLKVANHVGTPGTGFGTTPATAVKVLADARAKLTKVSNTPMEDCIAFIDPTMASTWAQAVASGYNPQGEISESIRRSKVFENANFKVFTANRLPILTPGTLGMTGEVVASTSATTGSTLTFTVTTGRTLAVGEHFCLTGTSGTYAAPGAGAVYSVDPTSKASTGLLQDFTVLSSSTSTTTVTVQVYPPLITSGAFQNVSNAPTVSTCVVTPVSKLTQANAASYIQNVAMWKDAIALATVPIKPPSELKSKMIVEEGIGFAITMGSDIKDYVDINRVDIVCGTGLIYPDQCCVFPN